MFREAGGTKIEVLIDIFTAELLRTLDRYGDLDTTVKIHQIADRAIRALQGVQEKAKDQARILLDQAGCDQIEARHGVVSRKKIFKVDRRIWQELCRDYRICKDAQNQLRMAQIRVEKLQEEYVCRTEAFEIEIKEDSKAIKQ